jgi:non-specific serine/threonine protein kinase
VLNGTELAGLAGMIGDLPTARDVATQVHAEAVHAGYLRGAANAETFLGHLAIREAQFDEARVLLTNSLHTWEQLNLPVEVGNTYIGQAAVVISVRDLTSGTRYSRAALGVGAVRDPDTLQVSVLNNAAFLGTVELIAHLALICGQNAHVVRLLAFMFARRERLGMPLPPANYAATEPVLQAARTALGRTAAHHELVGRSMSLRQLYEEALEVGPPHGDAPVRVLSPLSVREQEIAMLVARGFSNREIASELSIAYTTVERHIHNILTRLNLVRRTQLAAWVQEQPLTPSTDQRA